MAEVTDEDLVVYATLRLVGDDADVAADLQTILQRAGGNISAEQAAVRERVEKRAEAEIQETKRQASKIAAEVRKTQEKIGRAEFEAIRQANRIKLEEIKHHHDQVLEQARQQGSQILAELEDHLKRGRQVQRQADNLALEESKQQNRLALQAQRTSDRTLEQNAKAAKDRVGQVQREASARRLVDARKDASLEVNAAREASRRNIEVWRRQQAQIRDVTRSALTRDLSDRRAQQARQRDAQRAADRIAAQDNAAHLSEMLAEQRAAAREAEQIRQAEYRERLQEQRAAQQRELLEQRAADRSQYVAEQAAEARRTVRARAFMRVFSTTYETGLRGVARVWESFWRNREARAQAAEARATARVQSSMSRQTSAVRQSLDAQNREYSRAAERRLQIIERQAGREARAITQAQVRQVEATQALQSQAQAGLTGLVAGGAGSSFLRRALPAVGLGAVLGGSLTAGFDRLTTIEDASTALTVSLGDATKAAEVLDSVLATVRGTPFNLDQFAMGAQQLVGMGVEAEKIPDYLTAIGEASATQGKRANEFAGRLIDVFGTVASVGNISGEEIRRIAEAGVPALAILANEFGVTRDEMKSMISDGAVPAKEALDALAKGIVEGTDGPAGATRGLAGTMAALRKELSGSLGGVKSAYARFGASVLAPFQDILITTFNGVADSLDRAGKILGGFLTSFIKGTGVWKVARDALVGFVATVGALVGLKAAIEVVGLLRGAVVALNAVLLANPLLLVATGLALIAGATTALLRNNDRARAFWDGLVDGTREWIKVGYRIDKPITDLSKLVLIQSSLGAAARATKDFFSGLITGTREWIKVGYRIKEPITDLSVMVALQTSIGSFARAFKDSMGLIVSAVNAIREGDVDAAGEFGRRFINNLRDSVAPARDAVVESLRGAMRSVADWLRTEALPILASARLSTGAFLLAALGLTGSGGGFVSNVLRKAITRVFIGAVSNLDSAQGAKELGQRVNDAFQKAVNYALDAGVTVRDFFIGLLGLDAATVNKSAEAVGANLRSLIEKGLQRVGEFLAPVGEFLGNLGDTILSGFTTYVLPKLIELPRILGRFLSRTLFQENVLRAILAAAAALTATAVIIAAQFIRGFAEGLWQRRGDIAEVLGDIVAFMGRVLLDLMGSSPLAAVAVTFAGIFAGAKLFGALGAGITAIRTFFGNAQVAVSGFASRTADRLAFISDRSLRAGRTMDRVSQQMLRSALGSTSGAGTALFGGLGVAANRAGGVLTRFGEQMRRVSLNVRDNADRYLNSGMSVVAGGFAGYMAGMSSDAETAAFSVIGAFSSIGIAFATGGPVAAALAGAAAVVGFFIGKAKREANEAKAAAEAAAADTERISDVMSRAFESVGTTGSSARVKVIDETIQAQIKEAGASWTNFTNGFEVDTEALLVAAAAGEDAFARYSDTLTKVPLAKILGGDSQAIGIFANQIRDASSAAEEFGDTIAAGRVASGDWAQDEFDAATIALDELLAKARNGDVDMAGFISGLQDAGFEAEEAAAIWSTYVSELDSNISDTEGARWLRDLGPLLKENADKQLALNEAQEAAKRVLEEQSTFADRFTGLYGRIKESLDRATGAYRDWVEATTGEARSTAQAELDILAAAGRVRERGADGLTRAEDLENRVGLLDSLAGLDGIIGQFGKESATVEEARAKFNAFLDDIAARSPEAADYIELIRRSITDEAFEIAVDSKPAIETLEGFNNAYRDWIQDPKRKDLLLGLQTGSAEERLDAFNETVRMFIEDFPPAKVFLEEDASFEETYNRVREELDTLINTDRTITVKVDFKFVASELGRRIAEAFDAPTSTGELFGSAQGRYVDKFMVSTLGEEGPEVVLPLTKPARMAQLLGLPQVQRAFAALPSVATTASSFGTASTQAGPNVHHEVHVEQTIVESPNPRLTAAESVRKIREAEFLGGGTVAPFAYAGV